MGKKEIFYTEAERLYVIEQLSLNEISSRLNVSIRTMYQWKNEGDWDNKRSQYLKSRQSFHEELYEFARELMARVKEDLASNRDVSANRIYGLVKLLPLILKVKKYEDSVTPETASPEQTPVKDIIREIMENLS